MVHKISKPEPDFIVGVTVSGEEQRVAGNEFGDFTAAGESEFPIEFPGVVEAEDLFGLFGYEFFGFGEESVLGITGEEGFEMGDFVGVGCDGSGAGRIGFGALGFMFLGGFGYEKRGGEGPWIWEFRV